MVEGEGTGLRATHRAREPEVTLELVRPLFQPLGITRIANVSGLDCVGIPTVVVVRPNARSLSVSQGKGVTLAAARTSGVMESIEQYCAERITRPVRLARAYELPAAARTVDTTRLPAFMRPFDEAVRIPWLEAADLEDGSPTWVPFEVVHLDLTLPLPEGSGFFLPSSSGLASGNNRLEAIVHGATELIERDALTLFYAQDAERQWTRRLDLSSVDDGLCRDLLDRYDRAGVDVALWEITSDVGVAAFLCSVIDRRPDPFRPVGVARGSGCHPDRAVALSRALCEAAQSRLTRIAGSRDDMQAETHASVRGARRIEAARALHEAGPRPVHRFQSAPHAPSTDPAVELDSIRSALRQLRIGPILTVDLSPAEWPVNVVRVVIPGLEASSDLPGYRPGPRAAETSRRTVA